MTTPGAPTDLPEEGDGEETSGIMAEAFASLAEQQSGVATEAPPDDSTSDDAAVVDTAPEDVSAVVEESVPEIDEDSPFAAAAAIFQSTTDEVESDPEPVVEEAAPSGADDESAEGDESSEAEDETTSDEGESATEIEQAEVEPAPEPVVEEAAPSGADDESAEGDESSETDEAAETAVGEDGEEEEEAEALPPASPYDLPGGWYVVHSYSGYENKVQANLGTRIKSMHMEDSIFDIVIPMEEVVEIKAGRKVTVDRKQFPGYILVRMYMDDDSWGVVRNTPGVTGFVGSGTKPTPLPRREVERILGVRKDEEKKAPRFKPDWEVGETVRVIDGPFADFNGIIEDINMDQSKVRVLVDIFGRETPVELNFEQIQKF